MSHERLYHLVAVNIRTGYRVRVTSFPMPHKRTVALIDRFARYRWRRFVLVEA